MKALWLRRLEGEALSWILMDFQDRWEYNEGGLIYSMRKGREGLPSGSDGKESAFITGDPGSIPGWGRYFGEVNGNRLQYSYLGKPMDRAWCGVAKGWTWLKWLILRGERERNRGEEGWEPSCSIRFIQGDTWLDMESRVRLWRASVGWKELVLKSLLERGK